MADVVSEPTELALPGDIIFKRHVTTRASNRRKVIIEAEGGLTYEGYSIGLDDFEIQIIELPSGLVSTVKLKYLISIEDSTPFHALTPDEKNEVDKRTSSFRKISQTWLQTNWPELYDRRDDDAWHSRQRFGRRDSRQDSPRNERTSIAGVHSRDVQGEVRVSDGYGGGAGESSI